MATFYASAVELLKTPAAALTIMIISCVLSALWLDRVAEKHGKVSSKYRRGKIKSITFCSIIGIWLVQFNFWPFINQYNWLFNLALLVSYFMGIWLSACLKNGSVSFVVFCAVHILVIMAIFYRYEDFVVRSLALVCVFFFWIFLGICICDEENEPEQPQQANLGQIATIGQQPRIAAPGNCPLVGFLSQKEHMEIHHCASAK